MRRCTRPALVWQQERRRGSNGSVVSAGKSSARLSCWAHWPVLFRGDNRPGDTAGGRLDETGKRPATIENSAWHHASGETATDRAARGKADSAASEHHGSAWRASGWLTP